MSTNRPLLVVAAIALVSLAGCVGGSGDTSGEETEPTASGPAGFDDATGGIEGQVSDEEGLPVEGAQVAILQTELLTVTDAAGRFVFSNLEPGRYVVAVQRLGYESSVNAVQLDAGAAVSLQVQLIAIQVHEPYHEAIPRAGIFECTWRHPLGSGVCGYIGQTNGTTGNPLEDNVFTNSARKWNYGADGGVMTVYNEARWEANSIATGGNLRIFFSYADRSASHTYCQADGFSPLTLTWERDELDDDGDCLTGGSGGLSESPTIDPEEGQKLQTFVSVGGTQIPTGNSVDVAIALDQKFEIWFSLFYWEKAPTEYSAFADA